MPPVSAVAVTARSHAAERRKGCRGESEGVGCMRD
jgi:hypothetical protein